MSASSATFRHVVIRASAGTGKTFQLVHRYLGLLLAGEQPDHVLAATFARKAAGEIVDRILTRLAEAIESPAKLAQVAEQVNRPQLSREQCIGLLRQLLSRLHRLRIGTLDSFFIQLAGHFCFELGLPLGWTIVDDVEDQALRDEAIQAVLASESAADAATLVGLLFKGETRRSITAQLHALVGSLYDVYLRTPAEAWDQVPRHATLAEEKFPEALDRLVTLPALADARFAKAHQADILRAQAKDWEKFVTTGLAKAVVQGTPFYGKPLDQAVIDAYEPLVKEATAQLVNALAHQTAATRRLLEKYDAAIRLLKRQRRKMRFDDVTRELAEGLRGGDVSALTFRLDAHLDHLLLDEFQDTSLAQWNVVRPFAEAVTSEAERRSFFCVGDVKQAIYGWRGGVSEIFDCIREELPGIGVDALTASHRSSPVIINAVNRVFHAIGENSALADHAEVARAWQGRYQSHTTAKKELGGHVRLMVAPAAGDGESAEDKLLAFAAQGIAKLAHRHPTRSIGVLVRRNVTVAKIMHLLRSQHQLPASEEGGNPLTDSAAVQLALSALKLADHPADTIARFHVAHSPLGKLLELTNHADPLAAQRISQRLRGQLLTAGYGHTLFGWLPTMAPQCDARELGRLEQLVELAYGYDRDATLRTDDFATLVQTQRVEDPSAANVRVMTVHQSKGLQFDIVVLPELDMSIKGSVPKVVVEQQRPIDPITLVCRYANATVRQLLPSRLQQLFGRWADPIIHEALCVLYVAMTRAIHALHMIVKPADEQPGALKISTKAPTYAMLLRAALAPDEPREAGKVIHESGLAGWDDKEGTAGELPAAAPERIEIKLKASLQPVRSLERQSPSALQGGPTVDLRQRLTLDSAATRRGTLLHAWFEAIEWLDDGEPDDAALDAIARQCAVPQPDLPQLREAFRAMLRRPVVKRTLSRAAYAQAGSLEVWRERRFAVREEGTLLQGSFDRVVLSRQADRVLAAEVIDFKSDRLADDAALNAAVKFYQPQLAAYRRALERMLPLDPRQIATRLLFVEHDRLVEV